MRHAAKAHVRAVQAARDLHKLGPKYVLIKGGHLMAEPSRTPCRPPSEPPSASTTDSESTSSSAQDQLPGNPTKDSATAECSSVKPVSGLHISAQAQAASQPAPNDDVGSNQQCLTQHAGPNPEQEVGDAQPVPLGPATAAAAADSDASQKPAPGEPAENCESDAPAMDVLFDGQEMTVLQSKRIHTRNTHGTGRFAQLCAGFLATSAVPLVMAKASASCKARPGLRVLLPVVVAKRLVCVVQDAAWHQP